jgi:hypothetical protein
MTGIVQDLIGIADSLYGIRDDIGAVLEPVYLVTRTWSGATPGDGEFTDDVVRVLPSPAVAELTSSWKLKEIGLQEGSSGTMLSGISKQSWPTRDTVDCTSTQPNVEKFYQIAGKLYYVKTVKENYVSWTVFITKVAHQG